MASGAVQAMLDVPIGNVDLVAFIEQMYRTSAMFIGLPSAAPPPASRGHRRSEPGVVVGPRARGLCRIATSADEV